MNIVIFIFAAFSHTFSFLLCSRLQLHTNVEFFNLNSGGIFCGRNVHENTLVCLHITATSVHFFALANEYYEFSIMVFRLVDVVSVIAGTCAAL